jgi:hypothetical protein
MKMSVMGRGSAAARALGWGLACMLVASVARADYSTDLGYPSGSATPASPYNLFFPIPGNLAATVKVQVTNIDSISKTVPAGQAATAAQMSAAAVAKANAVAAAVNNSADAKAKNITASVSPTLVPTQIQQYGAPAGTLITVDLPQITYVCPQKPYAYKEASAKLGEVGDAKPIIKPKDKGGMIPTPKYSPGGGGTSIPDNGLDYSASGVDGAGNPSFAGFGFYDSSLSNPTYYDVVTAVTAGETAYQVLQTLTSDFNTTYNSSGYSASFDTTNGTMTIDQPFDTDIEEYSMNNDTSLYFDLAETPSPSATALLIPAAAMFALRRHRRSPACH